MKILFFASLAEHTGSTQVTLGHVRNTDELKELLVKTYPGLDKFSYAIAVNKSIITGNLELHPEDEVAFLPSFSGG